MSVNEMEPVLRSLRDRLSANHAFAQAFTCPAKRGEPIPCQPGMSLSGEPQIPGPFGWIPCPVMAQDLCHPYLTWQEGLEVQRHHQERHVAGLLGLTGLLAQARLEGPGVVATPSLGRVRHFLQGEIAQGRCLVLLGPPGVGKSWSAAAGLWAWSGHTRRFWYFPDLAAALMDAQRREEATETIHRVELLVLDDFGTEYLTEGGFLDSQIDSLFWHRENDRLATILVTNLELADFQERVSRRIWDRLNGWGALVEVSGPSLRKA